jgi:hypothetical protein
MAMNAQQPALVQHHAGIMNYVWPISLMSSDAFISCKHAGHPGLACHCVPHKWLVWNIQNVKMWNVE